MEKFVYCSVMAMLTGILKESLVTARLLSFLRWTECVSLASTSSHGIFLQVKRWVEQMSGDISLGVSPSPIPCQLLTPRSSSGGSRLGSKCAGLSLGGPVPPSFTYLNEAVYRSGYSPDRSTWDRFAGCSCKVSSEVGKEKYSSCPCVHLNASVQSGTVPLFECHAACSCDLKCSMRSTQLGRGRVMPCMKLEFMGQKGWGAFSVNAIPRGTFVAEYAGEMLTVQEARRRVPGYDRDGLNYVLVTQEFFQGGKLVWRTVVDATTSGNVSRFFNHSCEPSLGVFVIRRGSMAPRLAFFTLEDVAAGCEMTYDYEAVGSAGGDSRSDHEFSQPVLKTPRRMSSADSAVDHECKGSRDQHATVCLEEKRNTRSPDGVGDNSRKGLRRPCLCGSRRCRGLLPCNRAVL